jgi:hypothetical protein
VAIIPNSAYRYTTPLGRTVNAFRCVDSRIMGTRDLYELDSNKTYVGLLLLLPHVGYRIFVFYDDTKEHVSARYIFDWEYNHFHPTNDSDNSKLTLLKLMLLDIDLNP